MSIFPVILSGGSGTRLWPMSRLSWPKQFLPLLEGQSPFQATLARLSGIAGVQPATIIGNQEHRFLLQDQLNASGARVRTLCLEPMGRNTAPAAAVAALHLVQEDPDGLMLVLPADHEVSSPEQFHQAVALGAVAARLGHLVVFGVQARWPESGYGYIERGDALAEAEGCHHVASFIEKPEIEIARRLGASGRHYWNTGIFLFGAAYYLAELKRWQPELAAACEAAAAGTVDEHGYRRINAADFERCQSISIDYAVLERTDRAAMIPATFSWSDIGSWNALWDRAQKDPSGNATQGDVHLQDVADSYIASSRRMVVGIGLRNTIVIETPDAVLVADREKVQCVRETVAQLRAQGRPECQVHRRVQRPWGHYEDIDSGERFRVKRIVVNPGAKLSLQLHHHRAEHWVVVRGTARITRDDETLTLTENQSTYIPLGSRHRLENPGKIPLHIVEIQSGAYLEEDDIVRFEDIYHRA